MLRDLFIYCFRSGAHCGASFLPGLSPALTQVCAEPRTRLRAPPSVAATRGYRWTSNATPQPPGRLPGQPVLLKSKSPPLEADPKTSPFASRASVSSNGMAPSYPPRKVYRIVSVQVLPSELGVSLNTMPQPPPASFLKQVNAVPPPT